MDHSDCLIIGGGFAGASAAIALTKMGRRVTLLEAKNTPGGRVYSLEDRETGEAIDNGQHLLMGCYHHTLDLLATLGTEGLLRAQKALRVDFADCSGGGDAAIIRTLDTSALPGKAGVAWGMLRLGGLTMGDKLSALRLALAIQFNRLHLEDKTALQFLKEHRQSDNLIRRFWEPIILATLNAHPSIAAASLLVAVFRKAFFADTAASRLLLPIAEFSDLLAPLSGWLERHDSSFRQGLATNFIVQGNRVTGVKLNTGETLTADCIVSAVPPRFLRKLIPCETYPDFFAPLSTLDFSPIISVYMWFDKSFIETDFVAMLGTQTQWIFNRRAICKANPEVVKRFPGHISVTISAGDDFITQSNDSLTALCLAEIRRAFPAARAATMLHARVVKEKMATLKITPALEKMRFSAVTPLENLFLAGDWTNTGLPATIEGAAQSGWAAAQEILHNPHIFSTNNVAAFVEAVH